MTDCGAIILATGDGVRMKSVLPCVMQKLLSRPMLSWVVHAVQKSGIGSTAIVVADKENSAAQYTLGSCEVFEEPEQLGTAHAVQQAILFIQKFADRDLFIVNGNTPLMDAGTIHSAFEKHRSSQSDVTVITTQFDKPFGYDRIVRDAAGKLSAIVQERDASAEIKHICEVSTRAYWFRGKALLTALENLQERANGHFNLVDTVAWLLANGGTADTAHALSSAVALFADDRIQLHELNSIARKSILDMHLEAGVDIPCFDGVVIGPGIEIGADTTILPGTILRGHVTIGRNCQIGPNTLIENSTIGDNVRLNSTQCYNSVVKSNANIGPFVHIRPNSVIGEDVHLGNFVEVKNSGIDVGTKVSHLTYVGDSDVGKKVNFGCGTVTVNYTGKAKFRTTIKDNAFIGCNTNLVAPVTVGEGAYTAAGSTITENVPDDALGIARARQVNKLGWCLREDVD